MNLINNEINPDKDIGYVHNKHSVIIRAKHNIDRSVELVVQIAVKIKMKLEIMIKKLSRFFDTVSSDLQRITDIL